MPVRGPDLAFSAAYKNGAEITNPTAVGGYVKEFHGGKICSRGFQDPANRAFHRLVLDKNSDALDLREMAHDVRVNPGNGSKFSRPVGFFMRPGEPGGGVRFPFGGHPVAEC